MHFEPLDRVSDADARNASEHAAGKSSGSGGTRARRRASFLRTLWPSFSPLSLTRPRRTRSEAELSDMISSRRDSVPPSTAQTKYPSGSTSYGQAPTAVSRRASLMSFFNKTARDKGHEAPLEASAPDQVGLALTTDAATPLDPSGSLSSRVRSGSPRASPHLRSAYSLGSGDAKQPRRRSPSVSSTDNLHSSQLHQVAGAGAPARVCPSPVPSMAVVPRSSDRACSSTLSLSSLGREEAHWSTSSRPGSPVRASRSDSRASSWSSRSYGPAPPRPHRSAARAWAPSHVRFGSTTYSSPPVDALGHLVSSVSSVGLHNMSSSVTLLSSEQARDGILPLSFGRVPERQQSVAASPDVSHGLLCSSFAEPASTGFPGRQLAHNSSCAISLTPRCPLSSKAMQYFWRSCGKSTKCDGG